MERHLTPRAINRARWFADLTAAIDDGERVLGELISARISPDETERLRQRLIELRAELERLNRVDMVGERIVGSAWPNAGGHLLETKRAVHSDWQARRD